MSASATDVETLVSELAAHSAQLRDYAKSPLGQLEQAETRIQHQRMKLADERIRLRHAERLAARDEFFRRLSHRRGRWRGHDPGDVIGGYPWERAR